MAEKKPDFGKEIALIGEKKEKFGAFFDLLLFYNAKFNLTAITEKEEVFHKHFLDSLAAEHLFPHGARCFEVGSGAGFPSVPLLLVRDDLFFVLIESTGKKCEFLRTAVREFGLHAEVLHARAEDVARDPAFREGADVCTARAVARLNTLSEYCLPLVKRGGAFIAYKGEGEEEFLEAKRAFAVLGGGKAEQICYELPEGYGSRSLVYVEKSGRTPAAYPRGNGAERRDPIR